MSRGRRAGVTLVELLVVVAILGVMGAVVGLAWPDRAPRAEGDTIAAARRRAAETGLRVAVVIDSGPPRVTLLALPDGRLVGRPPDGVDALANHE